VSTLWLKDGALVIDGSGNLVLCDHCPCPGGTPIPPCCSSGSLPATATATYTINALAPKTFNLTKTGSNYSNEAQICDVGDGHTTVRLDIESLCSGSTWALVVTYAIYVDGFLGNYVTWSRTFTVGTSPTDFTVSCSPYHLHFEGTNTSGNDADGATVTCGGVVYPFTSSAGVINLVLDIVTP